MELHKTRFQMFQVQEIVQVNMVTLFGAENEKFVHGD